MLIYTNGQLSNVRLNILPKSIVIVVITASRYPGLYAKGTTIKLNPIPSSKCLNII